MSEPQERKTVASDATAHGWSRVEKLAFVVLVVVTTASLIVTVHPWYDHVVDGSIYLQTARSIVDGQGYTFLGSLFHLRPPGFSCLLAPVIGLFGTNFLALNLFVSVFGIAGVLLLFVHQRPHLGGVGAGLTALVIWFNPGYQELCNQVLSDVPGVALLFACLLLERWASARPSWKRDLVLGLVIGVAVQVRSINLLLLPAIFLSRLLRKGTRSSEGTEPWTRFTGRRLVVFPLAAVLVLLPWSFLKGSRMAPPPADQTYAYDYVTGMFHEDPGDPSSPRLSTGALLERIPLRGQQIASVLGSRYGIDVIANEAPDDDQLWLHGLIAFFCVAALGFALHERRDPAELFALGALVVLLVYFGFRPRLLLPVYVIAFPAAVGLVRLLLGKALSAPRVTIALGVLLAALLAFDFDPHRNWDAIEKEHRRVATRCAAVDARLAADARLGSAQGHVYGVLLDRPVPGFQIAMVRSQDLQAIEATIDKYDLNTIVLSPSNPIERNVVPYFLQRYGEGTPAGDAILWRVRD